MRLLPKVKHPRRIRICVGMCAITCVRVCAPHDVRGFCTDNWIANTKLNTKLRLVLQLSIVS